MVRTAHEMLLKRGGAWFAATQSRRSRRSFEIRSVEPRLLDALEATCIGFRPFDDCRIELVRAPTLDVFRGVIGSYGKVTGAPHLLVMVADSKTPAAQQHVGYAGEACVLEATALGLDTCWVGGFFSRRKVSQIVPMADRESAVAVSPVGYAQVGRSGSERVMGQMAHSQRRKPISEIAENLGEPWPPWAKAAVECARIAPSAVNRQPWRFRIEDGQLVVSKTEGELPSVTKALDCGIAMLHAELGALASGITGVWRDRSNGPDVAVFQPDARV